VTGLSIMATDLTSKRLQVLKDTLPALTRVAVLANPDTPYSLKVAKELQSAAQALAIEPKFTTVRTREDIEPAFTAARHMHAQALFVVEDAVFTTYRTMLVELAFNVRLPVIYGDRQFA
jgi:putative ABC transport system substrate-binding protein